jgi:hypothetical protein
MLDDMVPAFENETLRGIFNILNYYMRHSHHLYGCYAIGTIKYYPFLLPVSPAGDRGILQDSLRCETVHQAGHPDAVMHLVQDDILHGHHVQNRQFADLQPPVVSLLDAHSPDP